jgi:hypothetical protein
MEEVELIAFHLPQFHTFLENDEWWGKGFTEWTNVKKSKQLFRKHNQPRVPLNDNYYDLSLINNLIWQMQLAKKYHVNGFCFYHYWFNGKLLMQKPLEMLRDYEGEKIKYCFCWANEPWTRSWNGKEKDIIMPQYYGNEEEWEEHYVYLLSFFKDDSYIKENNKPMLVLYRCNNIPGCDSMIRYWDDRCRMDGFNGIHIVEELNGFQVDKYCKNSEGVVEFEPMYTSQFRRSFSDRLVDKIYTKIFNYIHNTSFHFVYKFDRIWRQIINNSVPRKSYNYYLGAFCDWDNSARRSIGGTIYMDSSPQKFKYYLNLQKQKAEKIGSKYIFINAWNEWGEGAYLEPDKKNKYAYLKAISEVF